MTLWTRHVAIQDSQYQRNRMMKSNCETAPNAVNALIIVNHFSMYFSKFF